MGWCKRLLMCPGCALQQLFPAGITTCCCAVPCRGADEGRKGSTFALTLGYVAAKEQSLFSQALTDLATLIPALGEAGALQATFSWCGIGTF